MAGKWYQDYDSLIEKICPDYLRGLNAIVNGIPYAPKNILELGCGTGNLTKKISQAFPNSKILAVDKNPQMINKARYKLIKYPNIKIFNATIASLDFKGFDILASSLVIHLFQKEDAVKILQRIYTSGIPCFVTFDRVKGKTETQEKRFLNFFQRHLCGKGIPDTIVKLVLHESRKNKPLTLGEHQKICNEHGFKFELLSQNQNHGFVVYRGTKKILNHTSHRLTA